LARSDWQTVSLPIGLLIRLQDFLLSDYAKRNGFTSKADVISMLLREFLDSYEQSVKDATTSSPPPRLTHIHNLIG